MSQQVETVIVGAGQAGLAVSHLLRRAGREHLVLERGRAASAWRERRWDSFRLVLPNRYWLTPGTAYDGPEPDGFMAKHEVIERFERYIAREQPQLVEHNAVSGISLLALRRFSVQAAQGALLCRNVVIATGPYQSPSVPGWSAGLDQAIFQLHSDSYRNPAQLPDGAVLVVGTGQSGVQIAEELLLAGRRVYLCVGSRGWLPRRYLGRDITNWYAEMGLFDTTIDAFPSLAAARASGFSQLAGDEGRGHDVNVHALARAGVVLLGRAVGGTGRTVQLAQLEANLGAADAFAQRAKGLIDQYIAAGHAQGRVHDGPEDPWPHYPPPELDLREQIDLAAEGIGAVVWAGGYRPDYGFLRIPVVDGAGYPQHRRGVTSVAGLYFAGLEWQYRRKSSTLMAGEEDAAFIVAHLCGD
ncbi:MAG: NAD(P)-binding domain-containing protein [Ramlibacter sp.]|nr:NAD(P)-binding domain-containing protein [Ramlibacter sp.]